MRHLHLEFICASFSLGLAFFFFGATLWQMVLLTHHSVGLVVPLWLSLGLSIVVGGILLTHGLDGIRTELHRPKRRRHAK